MIELFHCFGATPAHRVTTQLAVDMLRASGCRHLAVNTHSINEVARGDDLPIGYWTATLGSVLEQAGPELGVRPVLNINHPTTDAEAVDRARRAVELTGIQVIKLEVLDDAFKVSRNDQVINAARQLVADGLEVWPLITPDLADYQECRRLGSVMVRVMGSPIGSRHGVNEQWRPALSEVLADHSVPTMLDGGVGSADDIIEAIQLGFDSVLVNSCLFADNADPVATLKEFEHVAGYMPGTADARR